MDVKTAIEQRRATKLFDPEYNMPKEQLDKLLALAQLTPTAFNLQHYRLLIVDDTALLEKIRAAAFNQPQVTDCSALIVICADLKAWEKHSKTVWQTSPKEVQDHMVGMITGFYTGNEQTQRDEALRSCGMMAQTLMLAAKSMDLDTCPMDGFDFNTVAKLIKLPKDHVLSMFVAVGKAATEHLPRPYLMPKETIVQKNTF